MESGHHRLVYDPPYQSREQRSKQEQHPDSGDPSCYATIPFIDIFNDSLGKGDERDIIHRCGVAEPPTSAFGRWLPFFRHLGLDPGPSFFSLPLMDRERQGGWVYIMANRYRGAMYVGVTSHLAARVHQHRSGDGSDFCARHGLTRLVWAERGEDITACIAHEKRLKRWRRQWKFDLIERANIEWRDLYDQLT